MKQLRGQPQHLGKHMAGVYARASKQATGALL